MNPVKENPCKYGLTPECFEEYPEFAKQAFAIRLLYLLLPYELSRLLPRILRDPLVFPGFIFPAGWQPGDPWPDTPFYWDGLNMPDFELLPSGLVVLPETSFPPGWLPGDPLPPGASPPPALSEVVQDTGALTPAHLSPFPPGLPGAPIGSRGKAGAYSFFDDFTTFDTTEWYTTINTEGTIDIVNERLRMQKSSDSGYASIIRADPTALLSTFSLSFKLQFISGASSLRFDYWTGTYYVYIRFELPDILKIWDGSDWQFVTLADFTDIEYTWRFRIDWRGCYVYRDDYEVAAALTVKPDTYPSGTHRFVLEDTGDLRIDNFTLTGI